MVEPTRICEQCGGQAWGRFCSYACWRASQGLPVDLPTMPTSAVVPPPPADPTYPIPDCVACGGTRLNSKGGACHPCQVAGRIPAELPAGPSVIVAEANEPTWSYCGEPLDVALPAMPPTRKRPAAAGQLSLF